MRLTVGGAHGYRGIALQADSRAHVLPGASHPVTKGTGLQRTYNSEGTPAVTDGAVPKIWI
ncbi:MAG: hypothetical protein J5875_11485 [Paludibacteraceae bacterium]|nr:hypothetical protein [Paludibacteraceae bacterium]